MRRFAQHKTKTVQGLGHAPLPPNTSLMGGARPLPVTANERQRHEKVKEFRRCLLQALVPPGSRQLEQLWARRRSEDSFVEAAGHPL